MKDNTSNNQSYDNTNSVDGKSLIIQNIKNSPGADNIPAEFIKSCKTKVVSDLIDVFNYIIEKRDFPDKWTEGILCAIHKGGPQRYVNYFRGITILPPMENIFEIVVCNRLSFLSEARDKYDKWNGGYRKNVRTANNMLILNGTVQKQLFKGKSLYVCFVDFWSR